MRFMQIESVLQTVNRSEPAKNRFSVALHTVIGLDWTTLFVYTVFHSDSAELSVPIHWTFLFFIHPTPSSPNFEEAEGAYWFWACSSLHVCMCLLGFAYGQEQLKMAS